MQQCLVQLYFWAAEIGEVEVCSKVALAIVFVCVWNHSISFDYEPHHSIGLVEIRTFRLKDFQFLKVLALVEKLC